MKKRGRSGRAHLEHPQRFITTLKEFPNSRLFLPPDRINRFQSFDRTGNRTRLDDTDEGSAEALPSLEEGGVRRDFAGSFGGSDGISWIEIVNEEGLNGFIWSQGEQSELGYHFY